MIERLASGRRAAAVSEGSAVQCRCGAAVAGAVGSSGRRVACSAAAGSSGSAAGAAVVRGVRTVAAQESAAW